MSYEDIYPQDELPWNHRRAKWFSMRCNGWSYSSIYSILIDIIVTQMNHRVNKNFLTTFNAIFFDSFQPFLNWNMKQVVSVISFNCTNHGICYCIRNKCVDNNMKVTSALYARTRTIRMESTSDENWILCTTASDYFNVNNKRNFNSTKSTIPCMTCHWRYSVISYLS